jgi:hypothetical protein
MQGSTKLKKGIRRSIPVYGSDKHVNILKKRINTGVV